ncbi:MAG: MBL fold metallo-hydrolase [Clostridiales bacterium]|nr:MBL fold metallo-hydrolase [Clostridiales bacterium]
MIISYFGHSMFQIELENGKNLMIDPYDDSIGYQPPKLYPDYICISHDHHDHNHISDYSTNKTGEKPLIFKELSSIYDDGQVKITFLPTYHDKEKGRLRGKNDIMVIETESIRILHVGDLGHLLSQETITALGEIDILCLPVGG